MRCTRGAAFVVAAFAVFLAGCGGGEETTIIVPYTPTLLVSGISPARGLTAGGEGVSIYGQRFVTGATVLIGGTAATSVTWVHASEITCTVPAGADGSADVTVQNPDTESDTIAGAYVYDSTAPADVTGFTATPGDTTVLLTWTNPGDADLDVVELRRSTTAYPVDTTEGFLVYRGLAESYSDTAVVNGTTYYYSVFALDDLGNVSTGVNDDAMPVVEPGIDPWEAIFDHQAPGGKVLYRVEAWDNDGTVESVTIDLSAVGGSAMQRMYDNGMLGDEWAGDDVYSVLLTLSDTASVGYYQPLVTVTDDHGAQATGVIDLDVTDFLLAYDNRTVSKNLTGTGNNNIYAVWEDSRNGATDIYFNCSHDGGRTWMANDQCINDNAGIDSCFHPRICCSGDMIYVVWYDDRDPSGNNDIYMRWSSDGGNMWMPAASDMLVNQNGAGTSNSADPEICCSGQMVYIAWIDDQTDALGDVHFNASQDGGWTWNFMPDLQLNRSSGPDSQNSRQMCSWGQNVYVSWIDDRTASNSDVYFISSYDGGWNWLATDVKVSTRIVNGFIDTARMCCFGQNVYIVFSDDRSGDLDVYVNASTDGGLNWLVNDVRVNQDTTGGVTHHIPWIDADADDVYVVWQDDRNGDDDVWLNHSSDGGANWLSSDVRVDQDGTNGADSIYPQVAVEGSRVYVSWLDDRDSTAPNNDLYFNYSQDNGSTWELTGSDIKLNSTLGGAVRIVGSATSPRISATANDVYFLWLDDRDGSDEVFFQHGRHLWAPSLGPSDGRIDNGTTNEDVLLPVVKVVGKHIYVVWQEDRTSPGNYDLFCNVSHDNGSSWQSTDTMINTNGAGASIANYFKVAVDGSSIYVVWSDNRSTTVYDVYFNYSHDYGKTWNTDVPLDSQANDADVSGLACEGNRVYVVWSSITVTGTHVYLNYSPDGGASWWGDSRIDNKPVGAGDSISPEVACSGNDVVVVWQDTRNSGIRDIYYNQSWDGGMNWAGDMRLDNDFPAPAHSWNPKVVFSGRTAHVAWRDNKNGSADVYIRSSHDGGMMWMAPWRLDTDSAGTSHSMYQDVHVAGNSVFVVWMDNRNTTWEGRMNISYDGGWSWLNKDRRVPTNATGVADAYLPSLTLRGNTVIASWRDLRNSANGNIFMNYSINGGKSWLSSDSQVDTKTSAFDSTSPSVGYNGADAFFTWRDQRNGDHDVFGNSLK
jgi:hypothetical protein